MQRISLILLKLKGGYGLINYGVVRRLLIYHMKPLLICRLIATIRGSYNTGAAANLNRYRKVPANELGGHEGEPNCKQSASLLSGMI